MDVESLPVKRRRRRSGRDWAIRVAVVVAVLVAWYIVTYRALHPSFRGRQVRTRVLVAELDASIDLFQKGLGQTPDKMPARDAEKDVNRRVRRWLTGLDDEGDPDEAVRSDPRWQGPYVEPYPIFLDADRGYVLVDSWGNPNPVRVRRSCLQPRQVGHLVARAGREGDIEHGRHWRRYARATARALRAAHARPAPGERRHHRQLVVGLPREISCANLTLPA